MPTWDLKDRGGKREQRWQIVAEGRSVDPWLDAVSLDFSPLFLVVPVDCSLKRPSLPKVPPTLKATHRQVGAVEPRPQVLDSNPGEGHGPRLCSSAAPFPRVPCVSPVGFVPYYPLPYAGIPASPANPHTSFHCLHLACLAEGKRAWTIACGKFLIVLTWTWHTPFLIDSVG